MKVIVSFTSYPMRIGMVHKVVESLLEQTRQADAVLLYLSMDEFPHGEADIPDALREKNGTRGFQIKWVEGNLKSHKKYYYALQEYRDDVVITVDDDTIYDRSMIEDLMKGFQCFPKAVSARAVRMIFRQNEELETYVKWDRFPEEYKNMPRGDLCAIGVGGILYPPGTGKDSWFIRQDIVRMAEKQDDLWLKYHEIMDRVPVVYVGATGKDCSIEVLQKENLSAENLYQRANDGCAAKLFGRMEERDSRVCHDWFCELMSRKEYIEGKKRYFHHIFSEALRQAEHQPVYLYGAGKRAAYVLEILSALGLTGRIAALLVTDKAGNPSEIKGVKVRELSEIGKKEKFGLIYGVDEAHRNEIENCLKAYDYQCIVLEIRKAGRYLEEFAGKPV